MLKVRPPRRSLGLPSGRSSDQGRQIAVVVEKRDFWDRLEYRVCRELAAMEDGRLRALWCDGFIPQELRVEQGVAQIVGHAWMGAGPREQSRWTLVLFLRSGLSSEDEMPWSSLLPPEDATEWLEIDLENKELRVHPHVGQEPTSRGGGPARPFRDSEQ
jgi:hypothetical protein